MQKRNYEALEPQRSLPAENADKPEILISTGFLLVALAALMVRAAVGIHPYSGENTPPMYGDYEAQRHWMEITVNLPSSEWYRNTTHNDLQYWGLDYPPLSAYGSFIVGKIIGWFDPKAVKLLESRGYQSRLSRTLMRFSVIIADVLILFPVLILCLKTFYGNNWGAVQVFCFVLSSPSMILIDHGHFQYNNVSLALFFASIYCFATNSDAVGAMVFSSAIYFKQMILYFAPVIASHLLGKLLRSVSLKDAAVYSIKIVVAIVFTIIIIFLPWITNIQDMRQIVLRIFPVYRGLFEDKVANVWCTLSLITKVHRRMSTSSQVWLCTITTAIFAAPFCIAAFRSSSKSQLLVSTAGCALSFYLFSYQVHEKQILIPLAPISLLVGYMPKTAIWASLVSALSIFPLMHREKLTLAFLACCVIHVVVFDWIYGLWSKTETAKKRIFTPRRISVGAAAIAVVVMMLNVYVRPPESKPDIFVYAITGYACAHFCVLYLSLAYQTNRCLPCFDPRAPGTR